MTKRKGIIVWDFDGVLFDTERFRNEAEKIFQKYGVLPSIFKTTILQIRKGSSPFSTARAFRIMRSLGAVIKEKSMRSALHNHLAVTRYFTAPVDVLLRRLKSFGFGQMILSSGASSYQYKKIRVGCGKKFISYFEKIMITKRPKYATLLKIQKKYLGTPVIFIDDTKENLELVKKHVHGIKTIYYSNLSGKSLVHLEEEILKHAKI
jgi:phosphoglycolate phosphatase-like HAD superfamily hydrolase